MARGFNKGCTNSTKRGKSSGSAFCCGGLIEFCVSLFRLDRFCGFSGARRDGVCDEDRAREDPAEGEGGGLSILCRGDPAPFVGLLKKPRDGDCGGVGDWG